MSSEHVGQLVLKLRCRTQQLQLIFLFSFPEAKSFPLICPPKTSPVIFRTNSNSILIAKTIVELCLLKSAKRYPERVYLSIGMAEIIDHIKIFMAQMLEFSHS